MPSNEEDECVQGWTDCPYLDQNMSIKSMWIPQCYFLKKDIRDILSLNRKSESLNQSMKLSTFQVIGSHIFPNYS